MKAIDLAHLVQRMRDAQRLYFKTRQPTAIDRAKKLEREVDAAVKRLIAHGGTGDLFEEEA